MSWGSEGEGKAAGSKKPPEGGFFQGTKAGGGSISPASGREARSAAAGAGGVRVLDHELGALQVFLVVDLGADQVLIAHGIDQQRHAVLGHGGVVFVGDFIEGE